MEHGFLQTPRMTSCTNLGARVCDCESRRVTSMRRALFHPPPSAHSVIAPKSCKLQVMGATKDEVRIRRSSEIRLSDRPLLFFRPLMALLSSHYLPHSLSCRCRALYPYLRRVMPRSRSRHFLLTFPTVFRLSFVFAKR